MRILGIGDTNDLGAMYLALAAQGHEVRVAIGDPTARDTLGGMVTLTEDWRADLPWIREVGPDGVLLFESASQGAEQDRLRAHGFQVIGGSAYGDRLENDRAFGQKAMADAGMQIAAVHEFHDLAQGRAFVARTRARYVFKLSGAGFASMRNYVGTLDDGTDMLAFLDQQRARWEGWNRPPFVLMEHLSGVEIGVGAYFDGEAFLDPVCLDWEHKRFFPGDLGELTGEMGTLVTYRGADRLFQATLARMAGPLGRSGYVGYVNLNTIVNERGVWPLEFTCRFGYPGFAILSALHQAGWDDLLRRMLRHDLPGGRTFQTHDGFAVGVVLTVPPFPYSQGYAELSKGMAIVLRPDLTEEDRRHLHFCEVAREPDGQLVTSGLIGYVMVVTGCGADVALAREAAYRRAGLVCIPNVRYRLDIGARFQAQDRDRLVTLGWLESA
jgi:phosphoribosylamine--glycine ligase